MDKAQVLKMLTSIDLSKEVEERLVNLVNASSELTEDVMDLIYHEIEMEAEKNEKEAGQAQKSAQIFFQLAEDLKKIEDDTDNANEKIADETLTELNKLKDSLQKKEVSQVSAQSPQDQKLEDIRNNLVQAAGAVPAK